MKKKVLALALAGTLVSGHAWAGHVCAGPADELAMKTSAMQQALMVAALSCNDISLYNRFVVWHQRDLQRADGALLRYFRRGAGGEAAYHAFKTKAANVSSLASARDSTSYCANAGRLYRAALDPSAADLAWFVSQQWPARGEFVRASCTVEGTREAMSEGVSRLFQAPASSDDTN